MLDSIKYLPFGWRRRNNACTPRGPQNLGRKPLNYLIGGSVLSFRAPRHRPMRRLEGGSFCTAVGGDQLAQGLLNFNKGAMANESWGMLTLLRRSWAFWGPWMTGPKAQLSMSVDIIGRDKNHEYKNVSFFHPRVFESVLVDYLNSGYGHLGIDAGFPRMGPLNWKPLTGLPVFAASCRISQVGWEGRLFSPEDFIFFPVTPKHFVRVRFSCEIYSEDKNMIPYFDTTPIDKLQQAITNTIQLELGLEAQAEWNRVAAECSDMSLSDEFAPLQWPMDPNQQVSAVDGTPENEAEKLPEQKEAAG